jgi:hypothetical protein
VQRVAVRVVDLAGPERRADRLELVAGREEGDAQPPVHRDLADAERRDEAELGRAQDAAAPQRHGARLEVLARLAHVLPCFCPPENVIARPLATARSCMTTVSAPSGTTPPVMMRTHCPDLIVPMKGFPANEAPASWSVVSPSASGPRSASPSHPWRNCGARARPPAKPRLRRARARAPSAPARAPWRHRIEELVDERARLVDGIEFGS